MAPTPEIKIHSPAMKRFGIPFLKVMFTLLFWILGPVTVRGKYRVPKKGGVLILSNHLADIDPFVTQLACPRAIHFMSKSELFTGLLGKILMFYSAFPVKRGEPDRGAMKVSAALLHAGEAVLVFPEGELSEEGQLLPLKAGVALIVRMAEVPVICLGVRDTNKVMPYGTLIPRPAFRRLRCEWGEPHTFGKDASVEEIMGWAEGQLRALTGQETY